ncbi:hypothetical protein D3C78_1868790 [compost metagenome]
MHRMQADLLAEGDDGKPRDAALLAQGRQRLQQVVATMRLSLQRGQPRRGEKTH